MNIFNAWLVWTGVMRILVVVVVAPVFHPYKRIYFPCFFLLLWRRKFSAWLLPCIAIILSAEKTSHTNRCGRVRLIQCKDSNGLIPYTSTLLNRRRTVRNIIHVHVCTRHTTLFKNIKMGLSFRLTIAAQSLTTEMIPKQASQSWNIFVPVPVLAPSYTLTVWKKIE